MTQLSKIKRNSRIFLSLVMVKLVLLVAVLPLPLPKMMLVCCKLFKKVYVISFVISVLQILVRINYNKGNNRQMMTMKIIRNLIKLNGHVYRKEIYREKKTSIH